MPQQVSRSSEEILTWSFCPLAMQIRSLMASTAPKAQHEPQVLWSRTSLMDSQLGQAWEEKNSSGMSWRGSMSLRASLRCSGVSRVPMRCLMVSRSMPSKQLLWPAFQDFWLVLTWSMMDWKSRKVRSFLATAERASRQSKNTAMVFIKEINYQSYNHPQNIHPQLQSFPSTRLKSQSRPYFFMRGIKLHSSPKPHNKMPLPIPQRIHIANSDEQLANAASCRSCSVKLPPTLRQVLPREGSQAQFIKAAIHKLRTESPQFSQLGFIQAKSRSYFFNHSPKLRKPEEKSLEMLMHTRTPQRKETKCYLPQLICGEPRPHDAVITPKAEPLSEDCNVILLKRNMRYRLQKLPIFERTSPLADPQLNVSVTGWHRNPEEAEDFPRQL